MLLSALIAGIVGDYFIFWRHIKIFGYDVHILPSLIFLLLIAGIFRLGHILTAAIVYSAAQTVIFSLPFRESVLLFLLYLIVAGIAYIGLYSYRELFVENRLYLVTVFIVYLLAMLTALPFGIQFSEIFHFFVSFTGAFLGAAINAFIATVIYLAAYLTHGYQYYNRVVSRVYQPIPWSLAALMAIILAGNLMVAYSITNSAIYEHKQDLKQIYDNELMDKNSMLSQDIAESIDEFKEEALRFANLPGAQYFYVELLKQRFQETYARMAYDGLEGICLLDEGANPKLSVPERELDEKIKKFVLEVKYYYSSPEYSPLGQKIYARSFNCNGKRVVVYIVPIYQLSKEPNKPQSRPTNRRSGFLMLAFDPRVVVYRAASHLPIRNMFSFAVLKADSTRTVYLPSLASIADRRSKEIIEKKLKELPESDKIITIELPAFDSRRLSFNPAENELYRIYQSSILIGNDELFVGMFYPESIITQTVEELRENAQLPVVYSAIYEIILLAVLLTGLLIINRRTTTLLAEKIKETEEIVAKRYQTFKELLDAVPMGIVLLNRDGEVKVINPRAVIFLGGERENISDTPFYPLVVKAFDSGTIQKQEINDRAGFLMLSLSLQM